MKGNMKKNVLFFAAAFVGGFISLASYKVIFNESEWSQQPATSQLPVFTANYSAIPLDGTMDFTAAAERTVNSVVHVKTESKVNTVYNPWMDFFGYQQESQVQMASGSGVIISEDGYIITNNHV